MNWDESMDKTISPINRRRLTTFHWMNRIEKCCTSIGLGIYTLYIDVIGILCNIERNASCYLSQSKYLYSDWLCIFFLFVCVNKSKRDGYVHVQLISILPIINSSRFYTHRKTNYFSEFIPIAWAQLCSDLLKTGKCSKKKTKEKKNEAFKALATLVAKATVETCLLQTQCLVEKSAHRNDAIYGFSLSQSPFLLARKSLSRNEANREKKKLASKSAESYNESADFVIWIFRTFINRR